MYESPASFLDAFEDDLNEREVENSLILGLARSHVGSCLARKAGDGAVFAAVRHNGSSHHGLAPGAGGLAAAAYISPDGRMVLSADPRKAKEDEALRRLAEEIRGRDIDVRSLVAPAFLAPAFAAIWSEVAKRSAQLAMRQRLYRLTAVNHVPAPPGRLRQAEVTDIEVVAGWMASFEAGPLNASDEDKIRRAARARIRSREVYLWDDSGPRSMAATARPTAHGITINAVYTPPEWRKRGLATACVARLSERLLRAGYGFCVLFTDMGNPTSNSIYQRVGFEPVCEFEKYVFQ